jgi:hypothetical protein
MIILLLFTLNVYAQSEVDEGLQLRAELDEIKTIYHVEDLPPPVAVTPQKKAPDLESQFFEDEVTYKRAGMDREASGNKVRFKRSRMDGALPDEFKAEIQESAKLKASAQSAD